MTQIVVTVSTRILIIWSAYLMTYRGSNKDFKGDAQHLPDGVRRHDVFHSLTRLTGWRWGESGPVVLLVHGWESNTGRKLPLVEPLLGQGYRVFAFDAPGHGLSPDAGTNLIDVGCAVQSITEQHGPFDSIISLGQPLQPLCWRMNRSLHHANWFCFRPCVTYNSRLMFLATLHAFRPRARRDLKLKSLVGWDYL